MAVNQGSHISASSCSFRGWSTSAVDVYDSKILGYFKAVRVGILHGYMNLFHCGWTIRYTYVCNSLCATCRWWMMLQSVQCRMFKGMRTWTKAQDTWPISYSLLQVIVAMWHSHVRTILMQYRLVILLVCWCAINCLLILFNSFWMTWSLSAHWITVWISRCRF